MEMFRFSAFCEAYELPILTSWLDHFERVGRPAGILETKEGLSVWRYGREIKGAGTVSTETTEIPARDAKVIWSVLGFHL